MAALVALCFFFCASRVLLIVLSWVRVRTVDATCLAARLESGASRPSVYRLNVATAIKSGRGRGFRWARTRAK